MRKPTLLALCLLLAACQMPISPQLTVATQATGPRNLTVFAAASLSEAFTDIGEAFKAAHPGIEVTYNFTGSQQLAQQLAHGAPADVFASANQLQMDAVVEAGRVDAGSPQIFAHNRLVVIYPKENPAGLASLRDLAKPGLKLVLAAKEVPVGGYSIQFLEKASQSPDFGADFMDLALSNVVSYEENVRAVYNKVALDEADAGIVYATDIPKDNPDAVGKVDIPDELNVVAEYPVAPVSDSSNLELAGEFVAYLLSPEGQKVLAEYGFSPIH